MKGHIFNLLETFIEEAAGMEGLEKILAKCSFDTSASFIRTENYPDVMLAELVEHATQHIGISIDEAHFAFGKWLFPRLMNLVPKSFSNFIHPAPFLATLDHIHKVELKKLYPDATPPFFEYQHLGGSDGKVTYESERRMFVLVEGVLQGVAEFFNVDINTEFEPIGSSNPNRAIYTIHYSEPYTAKIPA